MNTNPTNEHSEQPERIKVCVREGKDDWIGIAYTTNAGDPDVIHEYVSADALSSRDVEIREVLEGLATYRNPICWCPLNTEAEPHTEACRATTAIYAKLQPDQINGASSTPKG